MIVSYGQGLLVTLGASLTNEAVSKHSETLVKLLRYFDSCHLPALQL